jgi:4-hydroxy-3-polyprenylbenzoate decarboxylase
MKRKELILAITGGCGTLIAEAILDNSKRPVSIIASTWGKKIYEDEAGPFENLEKKALKVYSNTDLAAEISSGSYETGGMIIAPCSANTLAEIAAGLSGSLISRAAHCHLKEKRPLILCVRETPWTLMMIENARTITLAGGIIAPVSLPYYMTAKPEFSTDDRLQILVSAYADRILSLTGQKCKTPWAGHY